MKKRKGNDKNSGGAIANNKGRHQTDGPGGEELEELGESADNRGRFQGSNKKDGVVAVIVDVVAPLPAPALTSSISDSE